MPANTKDPYSWWLTFRDDIDISPLSLKASLLFQICGSNAAVERSFSKQARIQTRERNRLTDKKVDTIMKMQFFANYKSGNVSRREVPSDDEVQSPNDITHTIVQPVPEVHDLLTDDEDI